MAIVDVWHADDGYSIQGEELSIKIKDWPEPEQAKYLTLRLEELTQFEVNERIKARERNLLRLDQAKKRKETATNSH